ncbi:MAG: EAL domain-containing protein [Gammaproteobacteria bacterium]|nr:EAL domain-containing protein [Gammaproteobacteria bacterium]
MAKTSLMIVEDEVLVARDIKSRLERMGYEVIGTATKGLQAVDMAINLRPDLILMDINLRGDMDGITAAMTIHETYDVPVIFCTAYSNKAILDRAKISEPYGYVLKPFDNRELEINIEIALYKHKIEKDLRVTRQQFKVTLTNISDGVVATDATGKVFLVNPVAETLTGLPSTHARGQSLSKIMQIKDFETGEYFTDFQEKVLNSQDYFNDTRLYLVRADGEEIPVEISVNFMKEDEGRFEGIVLTIRDISKQIGYEKTISYNALYDQLTNLPNRALFMDRLVYSVNRTKRGERHPFSVLFIDLDEFRLVNEGLGHHVGDRLVSMIGERIGKMLRPEDTLSRFSGDIFVVLLDPVTSVNDVTMVCNRIQAAIAEPIVIDKQEINITSTVGIVINNGHYQVPQDLIRDADTAMHRAKSQAPGSYMIFDSEMHESVLRFMEWKNGIQQAIQDEEFEIYYQPIMCAKSEEVVSMEALIRWNHHDFGFISPAEFIPIAEKSGQIHQLGEWVLRSVCNQIKRWQQTEVGNIKVAVNLSAKQFESDIPQLITSILMETRISPSSLGLEITEGTAMRNVDQKIIMMEKLRNLGLEISIDDFGTGYSSLAYLKKFPIHTLKIDRSFIMDIQKNLDDLAITQAIIAMAQNLRLKVLAEGVETIEQLQILRDAGCDYIQGYYYSQALPADEIQTFIANTRGGRKVSYLRQSAVKSHEFQV